MNLDSKRVAFIATMEGVQWGGSEELWAQAASRLVLQGIAVSANVLAWPTDHPRIAQLEQDGVIVHRRTPRESLVARAASKLLLRERSPRMEGFRGWLKEQRPWLVVLSNGGAFPPIEIAELCIEMQLPFVSIGQANFEDWWPDDELASRYRDAFAKAERCYFVSQSNLDMARRQLGCALPNAEVVHNPFNVSYTSLLSWPQTTKHELEMACVARLHAPSKGQDLLIQVLSEPQWAHRSWRLSLFGDGPNRETLSRLAANVGLMSRIKLAGHISDIEAVWSEHHLLVLASRYEGLPLALSEAMLCGRPAVVTNVGGNAEPMLDGQTGFIAESATTAALSKALEHVWSARNELSQMGSNAARRIREILPSDPAQRFAEKLKRLSAEASGTSK